MGWTTAHTACSRPDAEVMGVMLRGHGITVFIVSDDAGATRPELALSNGAEVRVREAGTRRSVWFTGRFPTARGSGPYP